MVNRETWISLVAGGVAGLVNSIAICPLETIKTRFQGRVAMMDPINLSDQRIFRTFAAILKGEGIKGLYRGLGLYASSHIPTWTCYFAFYTQFKDFYSRFSTNPILTNMYSSISSGIIGTLLTSPVWVIRTRLIVQPDYISRAGYSTSWEVFRNIWKHEGFFGFYKGLVPSLFGVLQMGIQLPIYEYLKNKLNRQNEFSTTQIILSSIVSKCIASTIGYPHQVIRTISQIDSGSNPGILKVVKGIYKNGRMSAFYRGLNVTLMKTVPAAVVTFFTYEYTVFSLNRLFKRQEC